MEINTNRPREKRDPDPGPVPEKSRYLRRKAPQKLRKSYIASGRMMAVLKTIGQTILFLILGVSLAAASYYAYSSHQLDVRTITYYGCRHLDPQVLERIIRQDFPANVLRIDLQELRARLEQETWVRSVELRRVLPSDLVIRVEERIPSVILEMDGDLMLADDNGILLDKYDIKYGKLDVPVFKGTLGNNIQEYRASQQENSERIAIALKFLSDLDSESPLYTKNISEVDISDKNNLKLLLVDDTAEIILGEKDYLKRFKTLLSNLDQYQELKTQYSDIASVDLRFDGQIVYRPRRPADSDPGGKGVPASRSAN
jgi:cell division septal protein FtsQ